MRAVEWNAMVEQLTPPEEREPSADELHTMLWVDYPVTVALPRSAARSNTAVTDAVHIAALKAQQQVLAQACELLRRGDTSQPVSTHVDLCRPMSTYVNPEPRVDVRTGYRVQLLSGGTWFDVEGAGCLRTRASAEAWRDKLHHAQGHLVLRIVEPTR